MPSIAQLGEQFDVSASVVKAAISVLRTQGLVIGQQGKGVFVQVNEATQASNLSVADQLAEIRQTLKELGDRLSALESRE